MDFRKIPKSLKNFLLRHWKKWTILMILAMFVYIGLMVFRYIYRPIYEPKETTIQRLEINKTVYNEIMRSYSNNEEEINKIINKDYPNPFK